MPSYSTKTLTQFSVKMGKKFLTVNLFLTWLCVLTWSLELQAQTVKFSAEPRTNAAYGPDLLLIDSYTGSSYVTHGISASNLWGSFSSGTTLPTSQVLWTNDTSQTLMNEDILEPISTTNFSISSRGDVLTINNVHY